MDISGASTEALHLLHDLLTETMRADDSAPDDEPTRFGLREHLDWKIIADRVEAELSLREEPFEPLKW